jgi:glycogen debranching enzyme
MKAYGDAPAKYLVMMDCKPRPKKPGEAYSSYMTWRKTLSEARDAIRDNERSIKKPNTFGGLVDWGDDEWERKYRIYEMTATEIK